MNVAVSKEDVGIARMMLTKNFSQKLFILVLEPRLTIEQHYI